MYFRMSLCFFLKRVVKIFFLYFFLPTSAVEVRLNGLLTKLSFYDIVHLAKWFKPSVTDLSWGCVAQSVTCLATAACLTADPEASLIPAWSHAFVEIGHEIISTVILIPSVESFKKGCCQLQAKVYAQITG